MIIVDVVAGASDYERFDELINDDARARAHTR